MSGRTKHTRAARTRANSYDASSNTIDVIWSTGAAVRRIDPYTGDAYDEALDMRPECVRLGRLNAGAPLLNTHDSSTLGSVIGVVVAGSALVANGRGLATVALSSARGDADVVGKIRDGIIRSISVGYWTYAIERSTGADGVEIQTAVDFEPLELSAVAVPADPGSQFRSVTDSQINRRGRDRGLSDAEAGAAMVRGQASYIPVLRSDAARGARLARSAGGVSLTSAKLASTSGSEVDAGRRMAQRLRRL